MSWLIWFCLRLLLSCARVGCLGSRPRPDALWLSMCRCNVNVCSFVFVSALGTPTKRLTDGSRLSLYPVRVSACFKTDHAQISWQRPTQQGSVDSYPSLGLFFPCTLLLSSSRVACHNVSDVVVIVPVDRSLSCWLFSLCWIATFGPWLIRSLTTETTALVPPTIVSSCLDNSQNVN